MFPALEKKEILRNVSHAYSLDHQKEQEMFSQVRALIRALVSTGLVAPQTLLAQAAHTALRDEPLRQHYSALLAVHGRWSRCC